MAGNSYMIDKYLNDGKSIWLLNQTGSLLIIDFKDGLGRGEPLRIAPERKPLNLSNYYPPSMIKENPNLRRLIANGHVILMDPDTMEGKESTKPAGTLAEIRSDKNREKELASKVENLTPEEDVIEASPKVAFLCDTVKNKDMKVKDFIEKVDSKQLAEADLVYIINEMKDETKVVGWATEKLAALREDSNGEEVEKDAEEASKEIVTRASTGQSHEEYTDQKKETVRDRISKGVQEALAKKHGKKGNGADDDGPITLQKS